MEILNTWTAQETIDALERQHGLQATFDKGTTRVFYVGVDEEMWSQYIKGFNIHDWHKLGAKQYGTVFESCTGKSRHVIFVHTPDKALIMITENPIPPGATLESIQLK